MRNLDTIIWPHEFRKVLTLLIFNDFTKFFQVGTNYACIRVISDRSIIDRHFSRDAQNL